MTEVPKIEAGQTVWCRTADGDWWKTAAAGPVTRSMGHPSWLAVPVLGWGHNNPEQPVNWPLSDVMTSDPVFLRTFGSTGPRIWTGDEIESGGDREI